MKIAREIGLEASSIKATGDRQHELNKRCSTYWWRKLRLAEYFECKHPQWDYTKHFSSAVDLMVITLHYAYHPVPARCIEISQRLKDLNSQKMMEEFVNYKERHGMHHPLWAEYTDRKKKRP
jgi:hypothetical protein